MVQVADTLNDQGSPAGPPGVPLQPRDRPQGDAMRFTFSTGARPLGGFTIKRGIGVGGFGEVYYAVSDAGKEVALKRIQRHLDVELRGVGQCLNLKHPNLLSLYDIRYDDQGEAWVVMEYIVGESLRDVLDRCPNGLPLDDAYRWFLGLAAGVGYLHDRGIVHRDLKPANVFTDEGVVKIGDYGLSKFISCSRRSGQTESVGTFHYMAPEIGRGSYGKQIDIYALGVMLFELLTGQVPFDGESTQEIIMKHLTADPDLTVAPAPFRDVLRKSLMKDPEKRFSTVGEMVHAMRQAMTVAGASTAGGALPVGGPRVSSGTPVETAYHTAGKGSAEAVQPASGARPKIIDAEVVRPFGPAHQGPRQADVRGGARPAGAYPGAGANAGNAAVGATSQGNVFDDEPIARAVRTAFQRFSRWWNDSGVSTTIRLIVIGGAGLVVFWNSAWLLPLAGVFAGVYALYFVLRAVVLASNSLAPTRMTPQAPVAPQPAYVPDPGQIVAAEVVREPASPPPAMPVAAPISAKEQKRRLKSSESLRLALAKRTPRELTHDMVGSMLFSTVVAAVLTLVSLLLSDKAVSPSIDTAARFAWLLATNLVGTWSLLALGRTWERSPGDEVRRRFVMLVVGLGVGFASWSVDQFLHVQLSPASRQNVDISVLQGLLDSQDRSPRMAAYLLFFGTQFLLLRWWKQADSLRPTRLSLWDAGVCVLGALLVNQFVPFWSPYGLMLAATMSLTVQLSAPWINQAQRVRMREEVRLAEASRVG